jgi:hypothetical protein
MACRGIWISALTIVAGLSLAACGGDSGSQGLGNALSSAATSSSVPFAGQTLAEGDVVKVANLNGARMQPVTGGEVRGYQVSAKVLEFGTADQVDDPGTGGYRAPAGSSLIAFRTTVTSGVDPSQLDGQVVAAVSVDGKQRSLPEFLGSSKGSTTTSYLVAVPEGRRTVDLELKSAGVVQQFDLLEGKPKGDRPVALYRAASGSSLVQEALTPATFEVAHRDGKFNATHRITVSRAELGYFAAESGTVASSPDKAWLTLTGTGETSDLPCVVPMAMYKLTDATGAEYLPADGQSTSPSEPPIIGGTQFSLAYEVPAGLKQATLTVAPTQASCEVSTANVQTVPARGVAKVDITLPER